MFLLDHVVVSIIAALMLLHWSTSFTAAETYYVLPSPHTPCPSGEGGHCLTLSQYAMKPKSSFSLNITMILLPGNHSLNQSFSLFQHDYVAVLSVKALIKSHRTIIMCTNRASNLEFFSINTLVLQGLTVVGCGKKAIIFVENFSLTDSFILGQNKNGTELLIHEVGKGTIVNVHFVLNSKNSHVTDSTDRIFNDGGAITIYSSSVIIQNCFFFNNSVTVVPAFGNSQNIKHVVVNIYGGALSISFSHLTIRNSYFVYNTATESCLVIDDSKKSTCIGTGGAIYMEWSSVQIFNSSFTLNQAFTEGGAIGAFNSNLSIYNSQMIGNKAQKGGVLFISNTSLSIMSVLVNLSNFSTEEPRDCINYEIDNNTMEFEHDCVLCKLYDNEALAAGGVIFAQNFCSVKIFSVSIVNNVAQHLAGVIYAINTEIVIKNSHFYYNAALADDAGGGVIFSDNCSLNITASVFFYNSASANGGVVYTYPFTSLIFCSVIFGRNFATFGGALFFEYSNGSILHSQFYQNMAINESCYYDNSEYSQKAEDKAYYAMISSLCAEPKGADGTEGIIGSGGALYIHQSSIVIKSSTFTNNTACDTGGAGYFGNNTNVEVCNSSFQFNKAFCSGGALLNFITPLYIVGCRFHLNSAVEGGGLLNANSHITMVNCTMLYNTGGIGGAIHCVGEQTKYGYSELDLENMTFLQNLGITTGGIGLYVCALTSYGYLYLHSNLGGFNLIQSVAKFKGTTMIASNTGSVYAVDSTIIFNGTTTYQNNSPYNGSQYNISNDNKLYTKGGSMTMFKSNLLIFGSVILENNEGDNGGAMLLIESTLNKTGTMSVSNNTALSAGGGIYAYQSKLVFGGSTTISGNTASVSGGAIHAASSTIQILKGTLSVSWNHARQGGGIFLELGSHIYVLKYWVESVDCNDPSTCKSDPLKWTKVLFINNSADYGGAVYVKDTSNTDTCNSMTPHQSVPTKECFYQNLATNYNAILNFEFKHVNHRNTIFSRNIANFSGSALYGGLLDRCVVSSFAEQFTNITWYTPVYYFQNITDAELSSISSDPVRICFCHNQDYDCSSRPPTVRVVKGKKFRFSVVAVDQVNHTVPSTVECSLSSQRGGLNEGETRQSTTNGCTWLNFTVFSPEASETLQLFANGPCKDIGISRNLINIEFEPCPIGFVLRESNSSCVCDPDLKPYITNCSLQDNALFRKGDYWIDHVNSGYIIYPHCPFDYCYPPTRTVAIDFNNSTGPGADSQCAHNRSGKLCGKCQPNHSLLLGGNRCGECSNSWLWLLIPFTLAGIALVVVLLVLNLTVAVGTISGLTFYANIVAANYNTFFPFGNATFASVFISWLNLDFGFEVCFLQGMDAYTKTWLQLVFPMYIISLVVAIIVISDYSDCFARLFTESRYRRNSIATLATLILLSYTKLLRTVINALSFTRLTYPDGWQETVWLLDANVSYLQGKHIPLFIAAVLVALVGLTYTLVLLSWQVLIRCPPRFILLRCWMTNSKLLAFIDAYHAPYNDRHRYWTGMLLLLRMVVYLVSAVNVLGDPRVNLVTIIAVVGFILSLQAFLLQKPFKKSFCYVLELGSCINLLMFTVLTLYLGDSNRNSTAYEYTSVCVAVGVLVVLLVYHIMWFTPIHELPNFVTSLLRSRSLRRKDTEVNLPLQSTSLSCPDLDDAPSVTVVNANPTILNTSTLETVYVSDANSTQDSCCSTTYDCGQGQDSDHDDSDLSGADETEPLLK